MFLHRRTVAYLQKVLTGLHLHPSYGVKSASVAVSFFPVSGVSNPIFFSLSLCLSPFSLI